MEAGTRERQQGSGSEGGTLPEDAPPAIEKAAAGGAESKKVTPQEEQDALRWLLGSGGKSIEHTVEIEWDTADEGRKTIPWRIRSLPAKRIEEIENENRETPDDPFSQLREPRASASLVAEATVWPDIRSAEFRTPAEATELNPGREPDADPTDALMRVFMFQPGLLSGIAGEIRSISGYDPRRVGPARRTVTRAVGNS